MAMPPQAKPVSERFWPKVAKSDGCWEWRGAKTLGYGRINVGRRSILAHRVSYEMANGPIADGLVVCHRCDNPSCVRPDHLFLGTLGDNNADMFAKGRGTTAAANATHCKRGHPFDEANTYLYLNAKRRRVRACKACGLMRNRARRALAVNA
jgi:hypothetical protein